MRINKLFPETDFKNFCLFFMSLLIALTVQKQSSLEQNLLYFLTKRLKQN